MQWLWAWGTVDGTVTFDFSGMRLVPLHRRSLMTTQDVWQTAGGNVIT